MAVLGALVGLAVLLVVHELGHYLFARLTGMRVVHFALGFGPSMLTLHGPQTRFTVGVLPIGGGVRILGQSASDAVSADVPDAFGAKPLWARALVVLGGPLFNVLLALGVYVYLFASFNTLRVDLRPQPTVFVRDVRGPFASAGAARGDAIIAVEGAAVETYADAMLALLARAETGPGRPIRVTVARAPTDTIPEWREAPAGRLDAAGEWQATEGLRMRTPLVDPAWPRVELMVTPEDTEGGVHFGIAPELARFGTSDMGAAARFAWQETMAVNAVLGGTVLKWVKLEEAPNLVSPVKVTRVGADSVRSGFSDYYLNLFAMLSLNLALVNMLPLPALDGGRLTFLIAEGVMRRPVPRRFEAWLHAAGFVAFFALVLALMLSETIDALTGR